MITLLSEQTPTKPNPPMTLQGKVMGSIKAYTFNVA